MPTTARVISHGVLMCESWMSATRSLRSPDDPAKAQVSHHPKGVTGESAGLGLLVKLCGVGGCRESASLGLPVQRARFRPAPPDVPSRCPLSGNRRSRPERHQ